MFLPVVEVGCLAAGPARCRRSGAGCQVSQDQLASLSDSDATGRGHKMASFGSLKRTPVECLGRIILADLVKHFGVRLEGLKPVRKHLRHVKRAPVLPRQLHA